MNKSADREMSNNSLFLTLTKNFTCVFCFTCVFAISMAIFGCNSLSVTESNPDDMQTAQSATEQFALLSPTLSFPTESSIPELSTPTSPVISEIISATTASPLATLLTIPAPISSTVHPATPTPTPSSSPITALVNGLVLFPPDLSHPVIIKNGEVERLSYEDTLLLGVNAPLLGMAVGPNGQLFSLSESFIDEQRLVTIAVQQGNSGKETFFDDDHYVATRIYGVVGDWLIISLVTKEPPPGQDMGDLAAISLDGSQIEFIGRDTIFTPIVSPDQRFVVFHEQGETKRWQPQLPIETLPLPAYWFGRFSPDGRYLALVDQPNDTLNIYDFQNAALVATDQVGGYLNPFSTVSSIIWNRTSDLLAYVSFREEVDAWILRTVAVTGEAKDYENFFSPAFSTDGSQMVVRLGGNEPQNLILNLQTGGVFPIQLRFGQFSVADPVFWLDFNNGE
jgi:hypothetical protein